MTNHDATSDIEDKPGFWKRQFGPTVTDPQQIFDGFFGILMPILCLGFDPGIFIPNVLGSPLAALQVIVYVFSAIAIFVFVLWLIVGSHLKGGNAFVAGVFYTAALMSLLLGLLMLPFSLIGIVIVIGLLGFTPFFTAFVYYRNARRATRMAADHGSYRMRFGTEVLGGVLVLAIALTTNSYIRQDSSRSIDNVLNGDDRSAALAVVRLKRISWCTDFDVLVYAYDREVDPVRRERIERSYEEITGRDFYGRYLTLCS